MTALVIKFTKILIQKVRHQGDPELKCLSGKDLNSAEELWVKSVQRKVFNNEYHDLLLKRKFLLKQLHLFSDQRGVIHCMADLEKQ